MTLLEEKLSNITLGEFLEVWTKDQQDRQELVGILQELGQTINMVELTISLQKGKEQQQAALKRMRETFNQIPPKWFHR